MSTTSEKISQRKRQLRQKLWPDVRDDDLWFHKASKGWLTVPRTMPIILRIMDMLAPKGKPVSATYLDLWCRTFDDSFVIASKPREMAYFAGFTGERAHHTWVSRIRQLQELGFIEYKPGASGPVNYILVRNPYRVIQQHIQEDNLREEPANALQERMIEVGAADWD